MALSVWSHDGEKYCTGVYTRHIIVWPHEVKNDILCTGVYTRHIIVWPHGHASGDYLTYPRILIIIPCKSPGISTGKVRYWLCMYMILLSSEVQKLHSLYSGTLDMFHVIGLVSVTIWVMALLFVLGFIGLVSVTTWSGVMVLGFIGLISVTTWSGVMALLFSTGVHWPRPYEVHFFCTGVH